MPHQPSLPSGSNSSTSRPVATSSPSRCGGGDRRGVRCQAFGRGHIFYGDVVAHLVKGRAEGGNGVIECWRTRMLCRPHDLSVRVAHADITRYRPVQAALTALLTAGLSPAVYPGTGRPMIS